MNKIITASLLVAASMLAGCAAPPVPLNAVDQAEFDEPLTCATPVECTRLWRKAQVWVVQNSGFKIQTATDAVIETYSAPSYSRRWAFRLTRIPGEGQSEEINLDPWCGDAPACGETRAHVIVRFLRSMRGAHANR